MTLIISIIIASFFAASCTAIVPESTKTTIEKGIEVEVEIKEGMNLTQIAQLLEEKRNSRGCFYIQVVCSAERKGKEPSPWKIHAGDWN